MAAKIETFLYGADGTHGVVAFALSFDRIVVSIAPWSCLSDVKVAEFVEPKIHSIGVHAGCTDELNLPWDIIGFDSYPLAVSRWKFVLCCAGIEYVFESRWPTLKQPITQPPG